MELKQWITYAEASFLTGKSEATIRRLANEYKADDSAVKKDRGKVYVHIEFLKAHHMLINVDQVSDKPDDTLHKKEAMQIALHGKMLQKKDEHIEALLDRKSTIPFWLSFGFIVLIAVILIGGWFYRLELVDQQMSARGSFKISYERLLDQQKAINVDQMTRISGLDTEIIEVREYYIQIVEKLNSELERSRFERDQASIKIESLQQQQIEHQKALNQILSKKADDLVEVTDEDTDPIKG